jgi:peptide/nickel transport system substrate-binding protein
MDNSVNIYQKRVRIGDPHTNSDTSTRVSMLFSIYDALVRRDGIGTFKPGLAEEWSVSSDAKTWLFKLRKGVTFHNGERLTAEDAVATFHRFRDPSMEGEAGTKGVYPSYFEKTVASAPHEHTFKLELETPMSDLLDLLIEMPIAPRNHLDTIEEDLSGTGPYVLEEQTDKQLVIVANKDYWGGTAPYDTVNWIKETDPVKRLEALNRGEADIIPRLNVKLHDKVGPNAKIVEKESNVCMIYFFNAQKGPCMDKRVRQALNYGINKKTLIDLALDGAGYSLESVFSPLSPGYVPDVPGYPYDPDRARSLLAEAGYDNGLKLVVNKPYGDGWGTKVLTDNLRDQYTSIGVELEISSYPDDTDGGYSDMVKAKDIGDMAWFDSSPLSSYRVCREKLHSGYKGAWWEGYSNAKVDAYVHEIEKTLDPEKKDELFQGIYREAWDDPPWLYLYRPRMFYGVSGKLSKWKPANDGLIFPYYFPK